MQYPLYPRPYIASRFSLSQSSSLSTGPCDTLFPKRCQKAWHSPHHSKPGSCKKRHRSKVGVSATTRTRIDVCQETLHVSTGPSCEQAMDPALVREGSNHAGWLNAQAKSFS